MSVPSTSNKKRSFSRGSVCVMLQTTTRHKKPLARLVHHVCNGAAHARLKPPSSSSIASMSWQDVRKKWLDKAFIPADRSGLIEPLKANVVNLWNRRPKLPPVWQYRWWWLKNWTMAIGTSIAVWQGAVLLARPSEPARLDDVMTMIPTLHAVRD